MRIYGVKVSPFVQRLLMAGRGKGHELELTNPPGMAIQSPEFQAMTPMGRIPLLELDDGTRICESAAIVAYLEETLSGPALLPADPVARARVREIEAVATLEYATGMRPVMVHKVFRAPGAHGVVEAALAQAAKGADALEQMVGTGSYAVGDTLTLADCILVPVLHLTMVIDGVAGTAGLVRERPKLSAYYDRMAADPVAGRSITEMTEGFAKMMARNAS